MATNVNAAAPDESPVPQNLQKPTKQTVDPYNVSDLLRERWRRKQIEDRA